MYGRIIYFDMRHPLFTVFAYPLYATFRLIFSFWKFGSDICIPVFLQLVNGQLFILSALLLERIFNNKLIKYYFICSYPVIINLFYFEKSAIVLFMLLLSIYLVAIDSKHKDAALILSSGASLTSCIIAVSYLFSKGKSLFEKLKDLLFLVGKAICFYVVLGRIFVFTNTIDLLAANEVFFEKTSMLQKICSYTHMVSSSFVFPKTVYRESAFVFDGIKDSINIFGLIVFVLAIVSLVIGIKKTENKLSLLWIAFSSVFVVVLGWAVSESPLFSFYFSWPFLTVTSQELPSLLRKAHISDGKTKTIHSVLITLMLAINVAAAIYISVYSQEVWTLVSQH